MMTIHNNPRSVLHALQPLGVGTSAVESLTSYLCRLAVSYSTSTHALARKVAEMSELDVYKQFDWHQRQLSGHREAALTWSSALSSLTSVPRLDALTFLSLKDVIAQNGLRISSKGQYCPVCFTEDALSGRTPYFRLAWEPCSVGVCLRHGVPLQASCSSCGSENIRHAAAFVRPGWCTKCGAFLGAQAKHPHAHTIQPEQLWVARQVNELLATQGQPGTELHREGLIDALDHIIEKMDGGRASTFASRIGLAKSTVHHWLQDDGKPTLDMSLRVASQCGISLVKLLRGDLAGWVAPLPGQQLALEFSLPLSTRRAPARKLDWEDIEMRLRAILDQPVAVPVLEAAKLLGVEARQLYLHCNRTTRLLGVRWKKEVDGRRQRHVNSAMPHLERVGRDLLEEGRAVTRREVAARLPQKLLAPVPQLYGVLRDLQTRLLSERYPSAVNDAR